MHNFFISAYATAYDWGAQSEIAYFKALSGNSKIIGIEHPFIPNSEKYNFNFLKNNIPNHWSIIITLVPATMLELKKNNYFGLASINETGRTAAVKLMEETSAYIKSLNNLFERKIVKAVHFQSAPKNNTEEIRGNASALKKSLQEINHLDWHDTKLNLEHCDAYTPNFLPQKGFLTLEDEIDIISDNKNMGIVLNWARSAIEARSADHVLKHIQLTQNANLLKGFFFSGCDTNWKDNHLPPVHSLLSQTEIQRCFELLNQPIYLGIKISNQTELKTVAQSVALNFKAIDALS